MNGDQRRHIETLRERIQTSEDISQADRDRLLEFSEQLDLLTSVYSDYRHLKLLRHCTRMAEKVGGLDSALTDRDATERILKWINETYDNPETNSDYRTALRVFSYRVLRRDEPPESVDWVPSGTPKNYDPMPDRGDMLDWEKDVLPMIKDGARNVRDKALIATQYEAGFRPEELYNTRFGDVVERRDGIFIKVSGKTGDREVLLIGDAIAYLNRWLGEHPSQKDTDYLWSKLDGPERPSYTTFLRYFKRAGRRAGIDKPVTPRNIRKSNAYWLASQGANATLIEDRQGRTRGSKHVGRYIARFGEEGADQYRGLFGQAVDKAEPEDLSPWECSRCGETNPRHEERCDHCRLPKDPMKAYEEAQRSEGDIEDRIREVFREEFAAKGLDIESLDDGPGEAADAMTSFVFDNLPAGKIVVQADGEESAEPENTVKVIPVDQSELGDLTPDEA